MALYRSEFSRFGLHWLALLNLNPTWTKLSTPYAARGPSRAGSASVGRDLASLIEPWILVSPPPLPIGVGARVARGSCDLRIINY